MENLATSATPSEENRTLYNRRGFIKRSWDFFGVLLLIAASLPVAFISPRSLTVVGTPNMLDDSWMLDTTFKAHHGVWLGRDVSFTYGPLYQWLVSTPSRWMGSSIGVVYSTQGTLPFWFSVLFAWLTLRLLLSRAPAWKRFVLLLLLCIFWSPFDIRVATTILLFAIFVRMWNAVAEEALSPLAAGGACAVLCCLGFLISADAGVYAVAALVIALFGVAIVARNRTRAGRAWVIGLLGFLIGSGVLAIAVNTIIGKPLDFHFWKTSLAIVSGYRWMEASQMAKGCKAYLVGTLLGGTAVFLLYSIVFRKEGERPNLPIGFLSAAWIFAVLAMQSGLVRSDMGHVMIGIFPMVFFTGVILFAVRSRIGSVAGICVALASSLAIAAPNDIFLPSDIAYRYSRAWHPVARCPDGMEEYSHACFDAAYSQTFRATEKYLHDRTNPEQSIIVFPYQTIFGTASGLNVAGGLMQTYLASGPYLSEVEIGRMEKSAAPAGLFLPEGDISDPIDGVSNFTRTPEVWFWLAQHYQTAQEVAPGVVGLVRSNSATPRFRIDAVSLELPSTTFHVNKRSVLLDLGAITWPNNGADFVRLRLRVQYPIWWKLRKPQRLQLEITRSDGSHELHSFIVKPNTPYDAWFYPWDEDGLARYFDDSSEWHAPSGAAPNHLRLWVTPLDWVSVVPTSVTITSGDAIRLVSPN